MKLHHCLVCMGSNTLPELNMNLARRELSKEFPGILFGSEMITRPLYFTANPDMFHNQLATFHTLLNAEEVRKVCKRIESEAGRTPDDKDKEIVKLDIDLLMTDNTVLKARDMEREYIREGMKELHIRELIKIVSR